MIKLLPSILTADFSRLEACLHDAEQAGVDGFHLDVMDGHFVPNLTFGATTVRACRSATGLFLEAHLMATPHEWLLRELVEAGANRVTVHVESTPHLHRSLLFIRELGADAGVALNPATQKACLRCWR